MLQLISGFGLLVMLTLAWAMSSNRRKVDLRLVVSGVFLQILFGFIILRSTLGENLFDAIKVGFTAIIGCADAGSAFVFGENFKDHQFAFQVLPIIIFFAALMSLLYHWRVIQVIVKGMAWVMQKTLRTSGAESLAAAANVFVGQTEAPLVVRPYLDSMTKSELMTLMTGGFATVAGSVMAAYVLMGIDAGHLLMASIISAPAALVIGKIMQPETERPRTADSVNVKLEVTTRNSLDAITVGAADGVKLAINVAAMLIAFLALVQLANIIFAAAGSQLGMEWSLEKLLGYLFAPFAWLMGIEQGDVLNVGELLGLRMLTNEYVAYVRLSDWMKVGSEVTLSDRSTVIATYALCGFANFSSIGIQIGGIGSLAPSRRVDLTRLGLRAMLGGTLAAFMTACVAGMLL